MMVQSSRRMLVLIVGGGPFGLMLAIELGRRGIKSTLIDAKPKASLNPQANATQARTMEHYRRLGFADEIRSLGLPPDYPTDIAYFTRFARHELARYRLPSSREARTVIRSLGGSWSAAELPHRVSQKFVEGILRKHAESVATVRFGQQLVSFEERPDHVRAVIEDVSTGEQKLVEADYLIGADGARSTVRRQLGFRFEGETGVTRDFFGGKMVAVYLRAPDFSKVVPHDKAWMYCSFNTQRRSWLASVNGRDEFAFHTQLKPGESEDVTEDRARELFQQALGARIDAEVIATDTWIAGHALYAEKFGTRRIFIGGDAAHLFTPAGGLGYNTAVEDAVNLGWKLAATIRGCAGPGLLESYCIERRMMAIRNTGHARALANSIGNYVPHPAIEEESAEGEAARAAASEFINAYIRREFNIPGITFGGRYDGSPIIVPDGAAVPADSANTYIPTASPGGRPPHFWLSDGRSLYDLFGFEWTLLVLRGEQRQLKAFEKTASRLGMTLRVVSVESEEVRAGYEKPLVLIRPDQIVAWRGEEQELDAERVIRRVLGYEASERGVDSALRAFAR